VTNYMSKGPYSTPADVRRVSEPDIASSAAIVGATVAGLGAYVAQGAVVRSAGPYTRIGAGSAVLENSVVVGARTMPTTIGRRTTFGHRCLVIGATVGNLCEIGNGSIRDARRARRRHRVPR
jgi:carbonic anhydrase/acetyltransferase-like protein (isoleucine patch superfamily)